MGRTPVTTPDSEHDTAPAVDGARTVAGVLVRLRQMILTRELHPGEQIRQEEMARTLGISRVPLREALRVLTTEGLLTHRTNQGYFVTKMSKEDLEQINSLLEFLETELIRTARWPTDEEVQELRDVNARMATAAAEGDFAGVNHLNKELHHGMFRLSPFERYRQEAERFWRMSDPYRLLHVATTDVSVAYEQHEQLIDALAAHDRALCLRSLASHRRTTQFAALDALGTIDRSVGRLAAG